MRGEMAFMIQAPWPPSANNLYTVRHGRKILSKGGREYHALFKEQVDASVKAPPGRLWVHIFLYPPNRVRRDIANFEKVTTDCMKAAGLIEDDCLIDDYQLTRMEVVPDGLLVIGVGPWGAP